MGEFFGQIIIFFYVLTILKYVFKLISKYFGVLIAKNKKFNLIYRKIMIIVMKCHNIFGFLTILFILLHFVIQFSNYGLNIFGLIAALTMLAQVLLGLFGIIIKKRPKYWAYLHRIIAVCILIAILIHIA